jgi:hypothetical protein
MTISSLSASTTYQIDVCVISNKGKGPRTTIHVMTASAGEIEMNQYKKNLKILFVFR